MVSRVYIALIFSLILTSCSDNIPFNSERWKSASSEGSIRYDMSDDLIKNYQLEGKDSTEIFQLLGKEGFKRGKNEWEASYTLGPCHRGIDYGMLTLTFRKGRVVKVHKYCH